MPPETVDSVEFVQRGSEASPRLTDRATAMCLCRRRTPRSCVAPAADRSNKLPFVAAVCIAVAVSDTAAQTAVSATRVNF